MGQSAEKEKAPRQRILSAKEGRTLVRAVWLGGIERPEASSGPTMQIYFTSVNSVSELGCGLCDLKIFLD